MTQHRTRLTFLNTGLLVVALVGPALAKEADSDGAEPMAAVDGLSEPHSVAPRSVDILAPSHRLFGIFPDHERDTRTPPTAAGLLRTTVADTFDPAVFAWLGVTASLRHSAGGYQQRYATAVADNAIGNFMTSAVAPSLFHQDPRYVALGHGNVLRRVGYALSRTVVTQSRSGHAQFNYSEIAGNAAAAGLSNFYYGPADRSVGGTVTRWGSQVLWNSVSNELKEFWPDVRQRFQR
jgi:hypothetical protein